MWGWNRYDGTESPFKWTISPLISTDYGLEEISSDYRLEDSADVLAESIQAFLQKRESEGICEPCSRYNGRECQCEKQWARMHQFFDEDR